MPIVHYPEVVFQPLPISPRFIDRTGQVFTNLTVIGYAGKQHWYCLCKCGNISTPTIYALQSGNTKSCGCGQAAVTVARSFKHGAAARGKITPEARTWYHMHSRCYNANGKDYRHYGGRGIQVCERWQEFTVFLEDMGHRPSPKHSLDRIDNDGNYEPGNCRWATRTEQTRNTRRNLWITFQGIAKTLSEWCETLDLDYNIVLQRIRKLRWDAEKALTVPTRHPNRHL